jgi:hypothetical protein
MPVNMLADTSIDREIARDKTAAAPLPRASA